MGAVGVAMVAIVAVGGAMVAMVAVGAATVASVDPLCNNPLLLGCRSLSPCMLVYIIGAAQRHLRLKRIHWMVPLLEHLDALIEGCPKKHEAPLEVCVALMSNRAHDSFGHDGEDTSPLSEPVRNGTFTRSFAVLLIATSPKSEEVADLLCHSPQMMGYRSPASARLVRSSAVRARISLREMQSVHLILDNHGACLIKSQLLLISGSMCSLGFGQRNQDMLF